ncbi:MAG: DUF1127 domain-containing protein [Mesorhizobium sp.]|uniref:DUF1127 domain-containing protein n=1 Tax=Mesorhizobium sp. TaxID=1871066 RepID=UPI000FE99C3A|nr:DUF1127 domain-containing protein [Mesorhizobium sp.]RWL91709.1 MAG: DUF1127 domain-containing protein [Mesorhizobium sp.]TIP44264.1 MAG: DUF1127 domain-containing protein [Mesorhizobium sp.]
MNDSFAPSTCLAAVPATHMGRRRYGLAALRSLIAEHRKQAYFRFELKRMARDNPHLIDDIGLTKKEVEAEIAKLPFWQR